uniref:Uncharacterized protein n=1 Tax=Opuntia streptacantha TaxID=393608 RepID=A0A7C8Z449_OPUST
MLFNASLSWCLESLLRSRSGASRTGLGSVVFHCTQFWYFDDCCIGMGRNAGIYNRHSPRHKCYYWNCCNLYLSCLRISDINSQDRTLVHLVSVVIPPVMRWFYLGPKWHRISIHVNCRCCSIPPWIMDV